MLSVNWTHVATWGRALKVWFIYVGICLALGWSREPRPDEIAFAVFVIPLLIVVPWACLNILVVTLWPLAVAPWRRRQERRRLAWHRGHEGPRGIEGRAQGDGPDVKRVPALGRRLLGEDGV